MSKAANTVGMYNVLKYAVLVFGEYVQNRM